MILVDTSSWIHMLRPGGEPAVRDRVEAALTSGEACWCPLVQLELWNGARGQQEQRVLRDFARTPPELPIDEEVWTAAYDLARRARATGVTVPATDVVIAACAARHGAALESVDSDFALLASVGEPTVQTRRSSRPTGRTTARIASSPWSSRKTEQGFRARQTRRSASPA